MRMRKLVDMNDVDYVLEPLFITTVKSERWANKNPLMWTHQGVSVFHEVGSDCCGDGEINVFPDHTVARWLEVLDFAWKRTQG